MLNSEEFNYYNHSLNQNQSSTRMSIVQYQQFYQVFQVGAQYWKVKVLNTAQTKLLLGNAETGDSSNRSMNATQDSCNCLTVLIFSNWERRVQKLNT